MNYNKLPYLLQPFSLLTWREKTPKKTLYLTFDDGPTPGITTNVLDILNTYDAKATFFCVGQMVMQNSNIYKSIQENGHSTGNHTFSHLNGWKTGTRDYMADINKASGYINSQIFRPPYGMITPRQAIKLVKQFRIIMWSVLTGDYIIDINKEKCLQNAVKHSKPGSIIVFHDSEKAAENCIYTLPRFLEHFSEKGFTFEALQ